MRLLLLRHGQTPSNVLGQLDTGRPGAALTALGNVQADAVPRALANEPIASIWVSTLIRTQQTSAPLAAARALTAGILDSIREIEAGDLELKSDRESQQRYVSTAVSWASGEFDVRMPGGENGHEFFERFDAGVGEIVEAAGAGDTVIVVSHGAAIRTWVAARSINIDGEFAASHQLNNTGLVTLERTPDHAWRLIDWRGEPIGGAALSDAAAIDPTGETIDERTEPPDDQRPS